MFRSVWIIARKELKEALRDGRFRWLAASVLGLLVAACVVGWHDNHEARRALAAAQAAEAEVWLDQGKKNPHSAAHFGRYAFKPKSALAGLDPGLNAYLGTAVWLEAHWQDPFQLRPAEDRTAVQRFGELNAAWIFQRLVPLFIILLVFAAIAGERERGTLEQLLSLGLSRPVLLFGKTLGLGGALALVLVPAALLGVAASMAGGAPQEALGALVLAAAYGVYCAVFLALALAVSVVAPSSRVALSVLFGFWILSTVLVPRLAADLAEREFPIPTARAFYAAIAEDQERGMPGMGNAQERREQLQRSVLEQYGVESLEDLPVNYAGLALQASEEHANLVFDHHFGELWRRYAEQERVHLLASVASPLLAVRAVSMAVAETGLAHHRHFAAAAESHRRELVRFLNQDMTENAGDNSFGYLANEDLWAEAPVFQYRAPSLAATLSAQKPAFGILALWLLAAVLAVLGAARWLRVARGGA